MAATVVDAKKPSGPGRDRALKARQILKNEFVPVEAGTLRRYLVQYAFPIGCTVTVEQGCLGGSRRVAGVLRAKTGDPHPLIAHYPLWEGRKGTRTKKKKS